MRENRMDLFCEKMREKHGASECRSFSGRVEGLLAMLDAIELARKDCVFLSALAPSEVIRVIMACGAVPVLCDVTPDSLTMDHRSLEAAVRSAIANDKMYPRAVIADNFCGMPFSARAIKDISDRMGLILIEDCGEWYGGASDGVPCGSVGDISLLSLGASSVFGTGGSGCLLMSRSGSELSQAIVSCDGSGYQPADETYAEQLAGAVDRIPDEVAKCRELCAGIGRVLGNSGFWLQSGGSRQKSSFASVAVISGSEALCDAAVSQLGAGGLSDFVRKVHIHRRSCFDHGCRGLSSLENASAVVPRTFRVDIMAAIHAGMSEELLAGMERVSTTDIPE